VRVRGALKNVDVDIPRDALVVFTGVSGSGKSSLAFGTLYAEAQRRYLESVAPYARRLFHQMGRDSGIGNSYAQCSRNAGPLRAGVPDKVPQAHVTGQPNSSRAPRPSLQPPHW
jgi:hypothetical protein